MAWLQQDTMHRQIVRDYNCNSGQLLAIWLEIEVWLRLRYKVSYK